MTKILLINCSEENVITDTNKGSEAVIISSVELLRKLIPDSIFTSFLNCSESLSEKLNLRVIRIKTSPSLPRFFGEAKSSFNFLRCLIWAVINRYLHVNWTFLIKNTRLKEYAAADIIIHLGMDYYSDDVGTSTVLRHSRDIMLGILLKKPVVIWAESMGPFRGKLSKPTARFTLNRVDLITVRDSLSKAFLLETGVNKPPLYVTTDPAFLFVPATSERVKEIYSQEGIDINDKPIIGVNPSHSFIIPSEKRQKTRREGYIKAMSFLGSVLASLLPENLFNRILGMAKKSYLYSAVNSQYDEYKVFFAQLANWLVEKYDASVLLIPHDQAMGQLFDDRGVTRDIWELVDNQEKVKVISRNYNAEEIKGIIGRCNLFIGARFHAAIAALSQGIPTVSFPYYHKFALMSELGQDKYICQSYTLEETKAKVTEAWARKNEIEEELEFKLKEIRELATLNGELVKKLLTS